MAKSETAYPDAKKDQGPGKCWKVDGGGLAMCTTEVPPSVP